MFKNLNKSLAMIAILASVPMARADVVISEIMYHPGSNLAGDEFVELYNTGGTIVSLDGWCFLGIQLCFAPGDTIGASGYLKLASDPVQFSCR